MTQESIQQMAEEYAKTIGSNIGLKEAFMAGFESACDFYKANSDKWMDLEDKIGKFYEYDDDGNVITPEGFEEGEGDLSDIGEIAATAFGYL